MSISRHVPRYGWTLLLVAAIFCPRVAIAQAPAPAPPPPPPLHEGTADFSFVGTSGNSSTQTIGLGGELVYRPAPWETRFRVAYVRNEAQDVLRAQSFLLGLRAQRPIRPRMSAYGQYGYQRDRFAGFSSRNTVEGGLAYLLIDQVPHKLVVDAGLGYANEQRLVGNNLSTATFGMGGLYTVKLSETSAFTEDSHFVFSLSDGTDWRYANAAALTAKLTSLLSLKVSSAIRYVHLPPPGFKNTDAISSVALVAKF